MESRSWERIVRNLMKRFPISLDQLLSFALLSWGKSSCSSTAVTLRVGTTASESANLSAEVALGFGHFQVALSQ